ncbi:MAG: Tol-Pal system beta propeller repeat protein TolB [Proteobacteria bacterium]|nr:Tol-Pal system beta propeller repeat protein TolB [Pseudomonadota bacterium]MBU1389428.1 Tol-Pal system beta propeller repeat protein TolB [Pseudomonadota bacterium]MBU1541248.1 Tol-Pal system beta propeller repeat protein TolB [Pseudomonadota bacterium]MBU2429311.1 Tol-Pal system beta propeller repeat protein TolB [Pseudomonadota bacterium]MBU2482440.1 Tol-Pal system beta propeller repeat protein TolB [Pseudomonadota bacterium]
MLWCVFSFICTLYFLNSGFARDYDFIVVSDPFLKKTPIAVTEFKTSNGSSVEIEDGKTARQILVDALNFTGYLKSMNPEAFLSNPAQTGIKLGQINFRDWTGIGADLLVTGGITVENNHVVLELRLIDTFSQKLVVGNRYSGSRAKLREMIHRFCGDISYALTRNRGVFDSRIAFVSTVNGNKEIFTCDFDGQSIEQVTAHKSISLSPSLSSDGQFLAYVTYSRGRPEIFIRNFASKKNVIVNHKGMNISPAWMPGQKTLAASLSFTGDQEIYLLTLEGEMIKRITNSWGIDVSPSFSPDGRKIAFTSKRTGTPQIHIMDIATQDVHRLTFKGRNNTSPAWSPDGRKIAYVGIEDNGINIYIMDVDSGMPVQLTMDAGDNEDPAWSPDGSMLAFTSTREGRISRLYVMNASGTDQRRLLKMDGKQAQPNWSLLWNKDN